MIRLAAITLFSLFSLIGHAQEVPPALQEKAQKIAADLNFVNPEYRVVELRQGRILGALPGTIGGKPQLFIYFIKSFTSTEIVIGVEGRGPHDLRGVAFQVGLNKPVNLSNLINFSGLPDWIIVFVTAASTIEPGEPAVIVSNKKIQFPYPAPGTETPTEPTEEKPS